MQTMPHNSSSGPQEYAALAGTPAALVRRVCEAQLYVASCYSPEAPTRIQGAYEKNVNQCNSGRRVAGGHS